MTRYPWGDNPTAPALDCDHCGRTIPNNKIHLLCDNGMTICYPCTYAGSKSEYVEGSGRKAHAAIYPDCPEAWHDMWDHITGTTDRACAWFLMNRPTTTFRCLQSTCGTQLTVTGPKDEHRPKARELGWSVGSDDVGSQAVCPTHRSAWGRSEPTTDSPNRKGPQRPLDSTESDEMTDTDPYPTPTGDQFLSSQLDWIREPGAVRAQPAEGGGWDIVLRIDGLRIDGYSYEDHAKALAGYYQEQIDEIVASLTEREDEIFSGREPLTPCPECGKPTVLIKRWYRYVHQGIDCWRLKASQHQQDSAVTR